MNNSISALSGRRCLARVRCGGMGYGPLNRAVDGCIDDRDNDVGQLLMTVSRYTEMTRGVVCAQPLFLSLTHSLTVTNR